MQKGTAYGDFMERKYLNDLIEWNNDEDRKPLLVLGARQVGKTYLIKDMFAESYYKNSYLRIDCSSDTKFVDYVFANDNYNDVLDYIQAHYDFKADSSHLLFFDEAQDGLPIEIYKCKCITVLARVNKS